MAEARDYDQETRDSAAHRYAYRFDTEVMHAYMMRTFEPHFRPGNVLESSTTSERAQA